LPINQKAEGGTVDKEKLKIYFKKIPAAAFALVFLLIFCSFLSEYFWTTENLFNIGLQGTVLAILAIAQTMVILSEGIDLSSGPLVSLCGVIAAVFLQKGLSLPFVILIAIAAGTAGGFLNGFLVARLKLPPFVATFGNMGVFTGLALVITQGASIPGFSAAFRFIAGGSVLGLPFPVIILAFMIILTYLLLYHTSFGTYLFGIGGNQEAVHLVGVNDIFFKSAIYGVAGSFAGVAALVMTSRLNAAHPLVGFGLEFEAIASVIVGGCSWTLANGNPWGSLVGAATIVVLKNGLNVLGIPVAVQIASVGAFLILAVVYDTLKGD
jgi:ribose transport system permease protein